MTLTQFSILTNHQLTIPPFWQGNSASQKVNIPWDDLKTVINNVRLTVRAYSNAGGTRIDIYVNGGAYKVGELSWGATELNQWREASFDITGNLANGVNTYKFDYVVTFGPNIGGSSTWIDALVLVDFTGVPPRPYGVFDPMLIVYGAAILGGGYLAYKYLWPKRGELYSGAKKAAGRYL